MVLLSPYNFIIFFWQTLTIGVGYQNFVTIHGISKALRDVKNSVERLREWDWWGTSPTEWLMSGQRGIQLLDLPSDFGRIRFLLRTLLYNLLPGFLAQLFPLLPSYFRPSQPSISFSSLSLSSTVLIRLSLVDQVKPSNICCLVFTGSIVGLAGFPKFES